MKSLTIRRRILISFVAILAVMSAMAGASYFWFLQTEREVRVRPGTHDARAMRRIRTMAAAA